MASPALTRKGHPGRVLGLRRSLQSYPFSPSIVPFLFLTAFCFPNNFADRHITEPHFNLVNKDRLDKILKVEVFVHKDNQLQMAHLIPGYTLISSSFQAPKCVIRANSPCLHWIIVVIPSFLLPEGTPILEGTLATQPIPKGIPKVAFPL